MSNTSFHSYETFFSKSFKDVNLLLNLYKDNENVLFRLPLYASDVSKLISISLLYNDLDNDGNLLDKLSINYHCYLFNVDQYGLDLRFIDGCVYHFTKPRSDIIYTNSELDGFVYFEETTATLLIPGYKKLLFGQNGNNYRLTKIQGYQDTLTFTYTGNKLSSITSTAYHSEIISFIYNTNSTFINIYRNTELIYSYFISHSSGVLTSISCNGSSCLWDYSFSFINNGIAVTDSFSNNYVSLSKNGSTYTYLDEFNLLTTIEINDDYTLLTDSNNEVTKYIFDSDLLYRIEKDNTVKFISFKNKKLVVEASFYEDLTKIGGRLSNYSIYKNGSIISNESLLHTYPNPFYQNELGITFYFNDEETLVKRYFYKGNKNQPVSTLIYYNLDDYDDYFGYVDFKINFYNHAGKKLLSTSPTISYSKDEMHVWRVVVLSSFCNVDYDYFEVEAKARGFYSRIYLYINAFSTCLANTYTYINNKLASSVINGQVSIYSYNEENFLIGDNKELISYNSSGQPFFISDPFNNVVTNSYDSHKRITSSNSIANDYRKIQNKSYSGYNSVTESDEFISINKENNNQRLLLNESISSSGSGSALENRGYSYDSRNNLSNLNINNHQTSVYSYNSNNDVISINEYTYAYSSSNLLTSIYYHDINLVNFQYDDYKRITRKIYNDHIISFIYDDKNRISEVLLNNNEFINCSYDEFYDVVTDINEDHYFYDEYLNLVSIDNNEYIRSNVIDYRNGNRFQIISVNNNDNVIYENCSSIVDDYQKLLNELVAISSYSCFFKKRKLSSSSQITSFIDNPSGNIISYLSNSGFEYKLNGSLVYGKYINYVEHDFLNKLRLYDNYQVMLLAKKLSSTMEIKVLLEQSGALSIKFYSNKTIFSLNNNEYEISTSFLDDSFHIISFNVSYSGQLSCIIDGTTYYSPSTGLPISGVDQLIVPSGNELYGILVNVNNSCLTNEEISIYKTRFNSLIAKNETNSLDYVKYPFITISNNVSTIYDYYSFSKTYTSSKGSKPNSIEYLSSFRDEDDDFCFDEKIGQFVYIGENKTLTYNLSTSISRTVSFFIKTSERNKTFFKLGSFELGTNLLSRLTLKAVTTRTTTWVMPSNEYCFISLSYSFSLLNRCSVTLHVNGIHMGTYSNIAISNPTSFTITNTKSYIKDLCIIDRVLSTEEILPLYYSLRRNIRHLSYYDSGKMIKNEQIRNDEGVISNTTYEYQNINGYKCSRVFYKNTYLEDSTIANTYAYDELGRVIQFVAENSNSFSYDNNGQIINATINGHTYSYTYDSRGNILSKSKDNQTIAYTYDSTYLNRLSSFGTTQFIYNPDNPLYISQINKNGSLISLTYEGKNLKTYNIANDKQITFTYDYSNLRKKKTININGQLIEYKYFYDLSNNLIKQIKYIDSIETEVITFLRDSNGLYGFIYNNNQYIYNKDILGNINKIIDINGNIVVNYVYSPYGELISVSGNLANTIGQINPYIYKDYYYDVETGLFMMGHRFYDPEIGRFISPDDVDYLDPTSIGGLNLYAYCNNDPVNYYDPSGHIAISIGLLIAGFVVGALVGAGSSIITQGLTDGFENINGWQVLLDGTIGGISGLLAFSGVGALGSAAISGGLGFIGSVGGDLIRSNGDWNGVNWGKAAVMTGMNFLLGWGPGVQNSKAIGKSLGFALSDNKGLNAIFKVMSNPKASSKGIQGVINLYGKTLSNGIYNVLPGIMMRRIDDAFAVMLSTCISSILFDFGADYFGFWE